MTDSVPNFPLDKRDRKNWFVPTPEEYIQSFNRLESYRHAFILSLIREGVLPVGCKDFSMDFPLDGAATITATYLIDRDAFARAIAGTQCQPEDDRNQQS